MADTRFVIATGDGRFIETDNVEETTAHFLEHEPSVSFTVYMVDTAVYLFPEDRDEASMTVLALTSDNGVIQVRRHTATASMRRGPCACS